MSDELKTVGYVGLGIMGAPMASNLMDAGFKLTVWNRTPGKAASLVERGAAEAGSPAAMAALGPDVICINVTDTPDVEQVLFGAGGIAEAAKAGLIVIDHSTISPVATQRFAERLAGIGVTLLDAPVSGGDVGARNGTLAVMVGGPTDAFDRCGPIFAAVGGNITHLGEAGMGQVCKACNQVAVTVNLLGVCEALALAAKSGLDLGRMIEVVGGGAGGSWQLANLGPRIAAGDHAPGFMIDLVLKDLGIIAEAAEAHGLPSEGASLARRYFRAAADNGHGDRGTQAMATTLEQFGGFEFAPRVGSTG